MIFRIPSCRHRALPLQLGLWWNKNIFTWQVTFTDSCRYDLHADDQYDTNKLCGIGFIPGFHHKDSARFGWFFDPQTDRIVLEAYCYVNGRRSIITICACDIGKTYRLELIVISNAYLFQVDEVDPKFNKHIGSVSVQHNHNKKLSYRLGIFFGGNRKAPHEIKIQLDRL